MASAGNREVGALFERMALFSRRHLKSTQLPMSCPDSRLETETSCQLERQCKLEPSLLEPLIQLPPISIPSCPWRRTSPIHTELPAPPITLTQSFPPYVVAAAISTTTDHRLPPSSPVPGFSPRDTSLLPHGLAKPNLSRQQTVSNNPFHNTPLFTHPPPRPSRRSQPPAPSPYLPPRALACASSTPTAPRPPCAFVYTWPLPGLLRFVYTYRPAPSLRLRLHLPPRPPWPSRPQHRPGPRPSLLVLLISTAPPPPFPRRARRSPSAHPRRGGLLLGLAVVAGGDGGEEATGGWGGPCSN